MRCIEEHRRVDKQLSGAVPVEILKRYEKWKDIARLSGPPGLRMIKGFHDEALSGEWKGHRSSRLLPAPSSATRRYSCSPGGKSRSNPRPDPAPRASPEKQVLSAR